MNKNIVAKRTEVEPGVWGYSGKAGSGKLILSRIESKLSRSGLRQESDQLWLGTKENRRNNNKQQEKKVFKGLERDCEAKSMILQCGVDQQIINSLLPTTPDPTPVIKLKHAETSH